MRRSIRVFLIVVVIPLFCFSQNKDQLKEQKKALEKEISYTSTLLNKTKENKKESEDTEDNPETKSTKSKSFCKRI